MLKVRFRKISTPFRQAFTTAHETKTEQPALQIALEYRGFRGVGETPIISYYPYTLEGTLADLQAKAQMIEQYAFTEPARFWHFCHHLYPENPFLVCALDLAYWALYAQIKKQSIGQLIHGEETKAVATFYTIGQDSLEQMQAKMKAQPWPQYKVKVSDQASLDKLGALMQNSTSHFAVDANAAWSLAEAEKWVPLLQALGVLFIEQPLAKDNYEDMKKLKEQFAIPFFADESFQQEQDLAKCAHAFTGINIKLTKCSGLSPAIQIVKKAKEMGFQTMLGCMNETEVGIYPAAQFGTAVDYCDLDGALLLDTPLKNMSYREGKIILS